MADKISLSEARDEVRVTLEGKVYSGPVGTRVEDFLRVARRELVPPAREAGDATSDAAIVAIVDGTLRELSYPLERDAALDIITQSNGDGMRVYRRSLAFVLRVAAHELFPEMQLSLDHALPFGAFYGSVVNGPALTAQQLDQLKAAMQGLIDANLPIVRGTIPLDEAVAMYEARGEADKLRLLKYRNKDYLVVYTLRDLQDYFFGYMVPSTGYLTTWDLIASPSGTGFLLRYPRRNEPAKLQPVGDVSILHQVYVQTSDWLDLLGVEDIGELNDAIEAGRARELILVAEALHEGRVADVADMIEARQPDARLILIAGPSSSGKTTFSKRLAIQLMAHGLKTFTLGLDNYFIDRDKTPRDENGDYDFEHLEAIDLKTFNDDLLRLMAGEAVTLPHYSFKRGKQEPGETVQLSPQHLIIVEGIHGMNPTLVRDIPPERAFRIYLSALTQLNVDRFNRVPTTDLRLLRRLVRDAAYRGYSAMDTLGRWESVRKGEKTWIFPYQENADVMVNSALVYELAVLKPLAVPLLLQVPTGTRRHVEAKRLLAFLGWVRTLEPEFVPDNSLLREFIGGSILSDYQPGHHYKNTP